jgi:hypothetical protein
MLKTTLKAIDRGARLFIDLVIDLFVDLTIFRTLIGILTRIFD